MTTTTKSRGAVRGAAWPALALVAVLAAGCGGGGNELFSPNSSAMSERDQMALNRATQANVDALAQVKGERAARSAAR